MFSQRQEFVSPEGLRQDGRRPLELRPLNATLNAFPKASGSAVVSFGSTRVLAMVYGPKPYDGPSVISLVSDPMMLAAATGGGGRSPVDKAAINITIHAAAFSSSSGERRATATSQHRDKRLTEWSSLLKNAFERVVLGDLLSKTSIDIFVEVITADGSVLPCCANAISLALIDAGVPMRDYLVATTVLYFPGQRGADGTTTGSAVVVDPTRQEEVSSAPIMRVFMTPRDSKMLGATIERGMPADRLPVVWEACLMASQKIFECFDKQVVKPYVSRVLADRLVQEQREEAQLASSAQDK